MKKIIYFLLLNFFSVIALSQISTLDKANGYKDFKFDTHINFFDNNLEYISSDEKVKRYKYVTGKTYKNIIKKIQYKVLRGNDLLYISNKYKITVEDIRRLNPDLKIYKNKYKVKKGTILNIEFKSKVVDEVFPTDKKLFSVFGDKYDKIELLFDIKTSKLCGVELKNNPNFYSVNYLMICGNNIKSLVEKYRKVIGYETKFIGSTFTDACTFGKIIWNGNKVVLELGADNGGPKSSVDFDTGNIRLVYSNSICFYKKSYYNSKTSSGF